MRKLFIRLHWLSPSLHYWYTFGSKPWYLYVFDYNTLILIQWNNSQRNLILISTYNSESIEILILNISFVLLTWMTTESLGHTIHNRNTIFKCYVYVFPSLIDFFVIIVENLIYFLLSIDRSLLLVRNQNQESDDRENE